jgi:hypothetical protein
MFMLVTLVLPIGRRPNSSTLWLHRQTEIPALVRPMSFYLGEAIEGQRLIAALGVNSGEAPLVDLTTGSPVLYVPLERQREWTTSVILDYLEASGWNRQPELPTWLFGY